MVGSNLFTTTSTSSLSNSLDRFDHEIGDREINFFYQNYVDYQSCSLVAA